MATDINGKFVISRVLAQARPAGTAAVTAYTKASRQIVTITHIIIANTTGSSANYSLFMHTSGSTYDQTTALYYAVPLAANTSIKIDINATLEVASGTIGIQTGTGSALTFNIFGEVKDLT